MTKITGTGRAPPLAGTGAQVATRRRLTTLTGDISPSARSRNEGFPLRIPQEMREAIAKTHPLESCFLEYLIERRDPRILVTP